MMNKIITYYNGCLSVTVFCIKVCRTRVWVQTCDEAYTTVLFVAFVLIFAQPSTQVHLYNSLYGFSHRSEILQFHIPCNTYCRRAAVHLHLMRYPDSLCAFLKCNKHISFLTKHWQRQFLNTDTVLKSMFYSSQSSSSLLEATGRT